MKSSIFKPIIAIGAFILCFSCKASDDNFTTLTEPIIIDHTCTNIFNIPVEAVTKAKQKLVIAYGHTSHGSQIITGMEGLDAFMTGRGYENGLFDFNNAGSNNALTLHNSPFDNAYDLGNPDMSEWASETRIYLNNHQEVNVIMWSWCGQVSGASEDDINNYLSLMNGLETDFPAVMFVYMTGHLDGSGADGQLTVNNNHIRSYCRTNNKILFDFADIESYDPDGKVNYMELNANDNCDYTSVNGGSKNWAIDWQESHTENTDWYPCEAAHSQALNGNRKAFAAWWLFSRLAGWNPTATSSVLNYANENPIKWVVAGNLLYISFAKPENIERIDLMDTNGKLLYSRADNKALQYSYPVDLSGINNNNLLLFRAISNKRIYSGKFFKNEF
jgi:hypothetical protein